MRDMAVNNKDLFKLYDLIQNGEARAVHRFLDECSSNINVILPCKGIGVLHLAVGIEPLEKSKEITEAILKHGGDPNLTSDDGITPLHIAAIWGRLENLKLLVGCGGDSSRRDIDGHSVYDYAVREQQWDVYDYLHDVVDLHDDSFASPCAYSLDLEKVLITTNQLVAEYEPITDDKWTDVTTCRKSEMVRDWCEKTTLVINKLYPTILGEKSLIDDESTPWDCIDFTNNTVRLPPDKFDDTRTTYKSCISRKASDELVISGIEKLHLTNDDDHNCVCRCHEPTTHKQRLSIYEDFSLPGSPKTITHRNYNTKSSLKKCKNIKNAEAASIDCDLNDIMASVQNKTNEWLSHSSRSSDDLILRDTDIQNSHRSSASSGVSSSFSGGNIALANVQEIYKYDDKEQDVVLIEKRLLVSSVVLPVDETASEVNPEKSILSIASSLPASVEYDNTKLRAELVQRGFIPGPINNNTRTLYLKKLRSLKTNPIVKSVHGKTYSVELEKSLRDDTWLQNLSAYMTLESKIRADFAAPNKRWREGNTKTSFTYLLLDPRLTDNLPARASKCSQHACWVTFVNSIFYIGKGKRSRPYSHLYQALTLWKRDFTSSKDKKVQHILDIWSAKLGVVCLHIFQNVIPAEAYTHEAAMIDCLGVASLKNLKSGNYYGVAASWPLKDRRTLGLYLLYKSMLIFLNEGERQLRPDDID